MGQVFLDKYRNDQFPSTVGKVPADFPEVTYWFTSITGSRVGRRYMVDVNNPQMTDRTSGYGIWDQQIRNAAINTDISWGDMKENVARNNKFFQASGRSRHDVQGQVIDVTIDDGTLTVVSIHKITDRDYVVNFETDYSRYQYVVRDCNHYEHAYNRFAKRIRTEINPILGTTLTVVDGREKQVPVVEEAPAPRWPVNARDLTMEQRQEVEKWADPRGQIFVPTCETLYVRKQECDICQRAYGRFLAARLEDEVARMDATSSVEEVVTEPTQTEQIASSLRITPEQVVELIQEVIRDATSPLGTSFDLYQSINGSEPQHICGHEDGFWLMARAMELAIVYANGMTPNVVFTIREGSTDRVVISDEGVSFENLPF